MIFPNSSGFLCEKSKFVPSDINILCDRDEELKSFMYEIDRSGPKMEPCGTSWLIGLIEDLWSFKQTYWYLPNRYLQKQSAASWGGN